MTNPSDVLTNDKVLGFFNSANVDSIILFIFFAIFIALMGYLVLVNRQYSKMTKAINDLVKVVEKDISNKDLQDKKVTEYSKDLIKYVTNLRLEVKDMHTWCKAINHEEGEDTDGGEDS